jgi:hypothetical protein
VAAAVVELDPLADPVGTAAEDDDLVAAVRVRLAARLVRAVEIRRERLELGRARVDALVDRLEVVGEARIAHVGLALLQRQPELLIAEAGALQPAHRRAIERVQPGGHRALPHRRDLGELPQEPRVDAGDLVQLLDRPAALDRAEQIPHPPIGRDRQPLPQRAIVLVVHVRGANSSPLRPSSSERTPFMNASLKVRPIAIASPTDFICVVSVPVGLRELLEVPARDLDDHVVDGRLEGGGGEPGDVVLDLVEVIAERELGAIFAIGKPVAFRRRAPTIARRAGSSRSPSSGRSSG